MAELLDEYVPVAGWDVSTTETNLGYIRRTIKPALKIKEVRRVRGPLLDNLYTRLQQCGNLACAGKPFTEHRHVPDLRPDPSDPRTDWQQTAGRLGKPSTAASSPPATRCRPCLTCRGSRGWQPALSATRSSSSPTKDS